MFKKARKEQAPARLALIGPSGSGKTYSAIKVGAALGKKLAVIDSERGSASKYAGDVAEFDVCELESFSPEKYIEAIGAATSAGYDVLVIDSLSHAWSGKDGALEMVDNAAARSRSGNKFAAWREVTPHHNALVDAILRFPGHIIVTMRAKTEWVLEENDRGKKEPRKIGLAPIQRDGLEYEFDVVADIDLEHRMIVSKTRCSALDGAVISKPGADVAKTIRDWLDDGHDPLADVLAELEAVTDTASLKKAKESARRVFRVVTNGRREKLTAAVAAAEERAKQAAPRGEASAPAEPDASEAACGDVAPEREDEAPAQLRECQTAEHLRAWIRERWHAVHAQHGPGAAARVVQHGEAIGVDVADVDRWLGEATPEAAE